MIASGTEAGTGETEGLDPKDDGPVPNGETPNPGSTPETGLVEALLAVQRCRMQSGEGKFVNLAELRKAMVLVDDALSNVLPDEV